MIAWEPLTVGTLFGRYFISYRSLEEPLAKAVEVELERRGQEVWRDRRNLRSGDEWREGIAKGIAASGDIITLLTPEAAGSVEVLNEIELGLKLKKRLHVFVTFDLVHEPALRPVYALVREVNLIRVEAPSVSGGRPALEHFAKMLVETVLAPALLPHPLDLSDFDRVYSKRLLPAVLPRPVLARYRSYLAAPDDPTLLTNFGLILAVLGDFGSAAEQFRKACGASASPLPPYFLALVLMEGRRPSHLHLDALDEAIAQAETAWERCKSPLVALLHGLLVWDAKRLRGPNLQALFVEAMRQLQRHRGDREEVLRFTMLAPLGRGPSLPVPAGDVMQALKAAAEVKE